MRKFVVVLIALLLMASTAYGVNVTGMVEVWEGYSYVNITTADNTAVKTAPGVLAGIVVNGGTMGAITIVDNTMSVAGTTIATISSPYAGQVVPFGVKCSTGITVGTAAATNLTVIYK